MVRKKLTCRIDINKMPQLTAILNKNFIEKRRNKCTTICECCSHMIIATLLVLGYGLSKVLFNYGRKYDVIKLSLPPQFVDTSQPITAFQTKSIINALKPNLVIGTIQDILSGPLPVPPFDVYVTVAQFATKSLSGGPFIKILDNVQLGRSFGNILQFGTLHLAPYPSPYVNSFIDYMRSTSTTFSNIKYYLHLDEKTAIQYILDNLNERTFALIVFREISLTRINYVIRQNYTTLPNTNTRYRKNVRGLDNDYQQYYISGFLTLQDTIDRWAFYYTHTTPNSNSLNTINATRLFTNMSSSTSSQPAICNRFPSYFGIPFPSYTYTSNAYYTQVGPLLGLAFAMSMLYPVSRLVKSIVEERETKMREVLKIMGLRESIHQLTWFITAFITFFWIAFSLTIYCSITFLPNTNPAILFAYFFTFTMSLITLSFLVSVFFSNSKLAAICGPVVLIFGILPKLVFFDTQQTEGVSAKLAASLLSPTAFAFGADIIAYYEYANTGVQFSNLFDDGYNMANAISMMIFDFFFYAILAWYFDTVLPHEYGTHKHPLFFLFPSYWIPSCFKKKQSAMIASTSSSPSPPDPTTDIASTATNVPTVPVKSLHDMTSFEPLTTLEMSHIQVSIQHLHKQYSDGKIAVRGLNLDLLEGQITCLLGHNGAGKSTTISVLTGMTTPSSGDCIIYGYSVHNNLNNIRKITGICPQQNVLFPSLTVREHLMLFGSLKGLRSKKLREQVQEIIQDIGLSEKTHVLSQALSGGMKRKLCLAMALIGNSKFVLLDEPTSGLDPYSRRAIWTMLQKYKANKVVILTTHYLDEADIVSDRVAILSEGILRCSGSSLFLKNRFGAGYILSISVNQEYNAMTSSTSIQDTVMKKQLTHDFLLHHIQTIIPAVQLVSSYAGEIIFQLPLTMSSQLGPLFSSLHDHKEELSIISYGVSITTLEQVFIKLAQDHQVENAYLDTVPSKSIIANVILYPCLNILQKCIPFDYQVDGKTHTKAIQLDSATSPSTTTTTTTAMNAKPNSEVVTHHMTRDVEQSTDSKGNRSHMVIPSNHLHPVIYEKGTIGEEQKESQESVEIQEAPELDHNNSGLPEEELKESDVTIITTNEVNAKSYPENIKSDTVVLPNSPSYSLMQSQNNKDKQNKGSKDYLRYTKPTKVLNYLPYYHTCMSNRSCIQFIECLRKRWIIAKRDKKGFFFQIIFPALQILLVLAILIVKINPAGSTLKLQADSLRIKPYVITTDTSSSSTTNTDYRPIVNHLSTTRMNSLALKTLSTSGDVTTFLSTLDTKPHLDYFAAYSFGDTIPMRLIVDWPWVKLNIDLIFSSPTLINMVVDRIGSRQLSGVLYPGQLQKSTINILNNTVSLSPVFQALNINNGTNITIPSTILTPLNSITLAPNNLTDQLGLNISLLNTLLANLTSTQVLSTLFVFSDTNVNTLSLVERLFNNNTIPDVNITIPYLLAFDTISYNATSKYLTINNITIDILNQSLPLNRIDIDIYRLVQLLPSTQNTYTIPVPSPYTISHNSSSSHGIALFNGELRSSFFQTCSPAAYLSQNTSTSTGSNSNSNTIRYTAKNHPLPLAAQETLENQVLLAFLTCLFILIPLCYIPAAFISFLVRERVSKAKHIQIVSSVDSRIYWLATYVWDMSLFLFLDFLIMMSFFIYGVSSTQVFIGNANSGGSIFILILVYGSSILPLCYLYSMFFENHSTCQIVVTLINFITGFIMVLAYFIMQSIPDTQAAAATLVHIFRFFPCYNLGEGLIAIVTVSYQNLLLGSQINPFEFQYAGRNILFMSLETVGYFIIVLLTEDSLFRKMRKIFSDIRIRLLQYIYTPKKTNTDVIVITSNDLMNRQRSELSLTSRRTHHHHHHHHHHHSTTNPHQGMSRVTQNNVSGNHSPHSPNREGSESSRNQWNTSHTMNNPQDEIVIDSDVLEEKDRIKAILSTMNTTSLNHNSPVTISNGPIDTTNISSSNNEFVYENELHEVSTTTTPRPSMNNTRLSTNLLPPTSPIHVATTQNSQISPINNENVLILDELSKIYPPTIFSGKPKVALKELSLCLKTNERFGFLGVNGAGKSTTLAILTGDTEPTSGNAYINGSPLSDPLTRLSIGFCPQTDPLLDLMNSYETLWFYGRIRGVSEDILTERIHTLIDEVGLKQHAHRPCGNYSGGNKRKLSLAIALIGDPKLILLDEPSSGMDPEARRHMWEVIEKVSHNRTVMLTTHSMEECEALCSRIGIIVKGTLQCLGTSQHLKTKFGKGYEIKIQGCVGQADLLLEEIERKYITALLLEQHEDLLTIRLEENETMHLGEVFTWLEEMKIQKKIVEYAVSQTSLEQIFIQFAGDSQEISMYM